MIDVAMGFLNEIKEKGQEKEWLELLETLRTVTEGKVSRLSATESSKEGGGES